MGDTKRQHIYQIPMATRSTDVSMIEQCEGRWALSLLREPEQAQASFFDLGTIVHGVIETAIQRDYVLGQSLEQVAQWVDAREIHDVPQLESTRRGWDTMLLDADRMVTNWYKFVHPDSDKRLPIYDEYEWPPRTEVGFLRAGVRRQVWGSIDALFTYKGATKHNMIVDWKSNTEKPSSDFQLQFYRFGLGHGNVPAHFHMLDRVRKDAIVVPATDYPGDAKILETIKQTERFKQGLLRGKMPTFNPDWYCNYCPVQHLCPQETPGRGENLRILKRRVKLARPLNVVK